MDNRNAPMPGSAPGGKAFDCSPATSTLNPCATRGESGTLPKTPTSVRLRSKLDAKASETRAMAVVVYGHADESLAEATAKSIEKQTLQDIEVIYSDSFATAIESTQAEYVTFCASGDTLPASACEALRRKMLVEDADLVIGRVESFSAIGKVAEEESARLSKKETIDRHDVSLNASLHLSGKLFRRSLIAGRQLESDGRLMRESALVCGYVRRARRIVGCPTLSYRRRTALGIEPGASRGQVSREEVEELFSQWNNAKAMRLESARRDIDALAAKGESGLLASRIEANATLIAEDCDYRALSEGIERFYRRMWLLDSKALGFLIAELKALRKRVYPDHWSAICERNPDLQLENGFLPPESIAEHPLVTVAITPQETDEAFTRHLDSLLMAGFPAFELVVSRSCSNLVPEWVATQPPVRFVDAASSHEIVEAAVRTSRANYLNVLDARIYHVGDSLRRLHGEIEKSRADFVCALPKGVNPRASKSRNLPAIELMYSEEFAASPTHRSRFCAVDRAWNNKMFKTSRLAELFALSEKHPPSAAEVFDALSFEKKPAITMACLEPNGYFASQLAEPDKTSYKMLCRWRKAHPFAPAETRTQLKKGRLKRQVLFCSNRERGRLSTSMQLVYDALPDIDRSVFCAPLPHSDAYLAQLRSALARSKVIVTDDYIHELRDLELDDRQSVIQLWHACGALKTFGLDNPACNVKRELASHRQYRAVMVSDESVCGVYARAFGISEGAVLPLGVPRTDLLLSAEHLASMRERALEARPELRGKQVILYCPTFRELKGRQTNFDPRINWTALDASLADDQVFVVKKHPLEKSELCPHADLSRVRVIDEVETDALLAVADLLVTDCSSIVFDCSLIGKPMIFYFPDYEKFARSFYVDFPDDLGGRIISTDDELAAAIQDALVDPKAHLMPDIGDGMMGACDGHSTERIAAYVRKELDRK